MSHLSSAESPHAEQTALDVITQNAAKVLDERTSTKPGKDKAVLSLMAAGWTPDTVRAIGPKRLNRLLQIIREDAFSGVAYRTIADMITHATNPDIAIVHTQWG